MLSYEKTFVSLVLTLGCNGTKIELISGEGMDEPVGRRVEELIGVKFTWVRELCSFVNDGRGKEQYDRGENSETNGDYSVKNGE